MKNIPTPVDNTFWETRPSIPLNFRAEWDQVKYNERPIYQDTDMISSQIDAYQYYSENNSVIHLHSSTYPSRSAGISNGCPNSLS